MAQHLGGQRRVERAPVAERGQLVLARHLLLLAVQAGVAQRHTRLRRVGLDPVQVLGQEGVAAGGPGPPARRPGRSRRAAAPSTATAAATSPPAAGPAPRCCRRRPRSARPRGSPAARPASPSAPAGCGLQAAGALDRQLPFSSSQQREGVGAQGPAAAVGDRRTAARPGPARRRASAASCAASRPIAPACPARPPGPPGGGGSPARPSPPRPPRRPGQRPRRRQPAAVPTSRRRRRRSAPGRRPSATSAPAGCAVPANVVDAGVGAVQGALGVGHAGGRDAEQLGPQPSRPWL